MSNRARIAVVGTGWWATANHLPALNKHADADIIAICDLDDAKARKAARAFDVSKVYTDLETMLAQETLDGVVVATYHASHYQVAKACLEHGLHIFIEKPMTLYAREAHHLVKLAQEKQVEISMGYNHNHTPYVKRARELVQAGDLGEIQYITGQFSQAILPLLAGVDLQQDDLVNTPGDVYSDPIRSGGGHGHLQITHLAGMLFYVTNLRIHRVQALMANHGLAVDLVNALIIEFENGALGTLGGTSNVVGGGRSFKLTIYGKKGWLDIDDATGTMVVRREGQNDEHIHPPAGEEHHHPFFNPCENFVDVITGKAENVCDGYVGWTATELLDAAYRSAENEGHAVLREVLY